MRLVNTTVFNFFQFRVLLKERVCSLVIKLFSPNIKYKINASSSGGSTQNLPTQEKPSYAITSKLLRVVAVLIVQVNFYVNFLNRRITAIFLLR